MASAASDEILELGGPETGPLSGATQSARAYRALRRAIIECQMAPGLVLAERRLMQQFGFGRTPLREALLRLAYDRLVQFEAGQVIRVRAISVTEIRDLYEDRLHSERLAAALMIRRLDDDLRRDLKQCFADAPRLLAAGQLEQVIALDFRFHSLIYRGSGNEFLIAHLHNLFAHSYRLWFLSREGNQRSMERIVRSHAPLLRAILSGDARGLDELLSRHIAEAFERVMEWVRGGGLETALSLRPRTLDN